MINFGDPRFAALILFLRDAGVSDPAVGRRKVRASKIEKKKKTW